MRYHFIHHKSGKVSVSYELTQCGGCSTGIWMGFGPYNTLRGAKIALRRRFPDTYLQHALPDTYQQ